MRSLISSGSSFEDEIGYSRAVVCDNWVFVSGTTGFNYDTMVLPPAVEEQTRQTFKNIEAALAKAGANLKNTVRVRYYFLSREDFTKCQPVLKEFLGTVKPAATMVLVAGLLDPKMKVEIDVTVRQTRTEAET